MDEHYFDHQPSSQPLESSSSGQLAEFNLNGAQIKVEMKAPAGTRLDLRVHAHTPGRFFSACRRVVMGPVSPFSARAAMIWSRLNRPQSAMLAAVLIYMLVRLVGLVNFPIYFFSDEAAQTVLAADLVRDGLRNWDGDLLPTFFQNTDKYSLGISVYLQVLPYLMFGKSVWVTRAVCVLMSGLAALAVGGVLKKAFRLNIPWAGILLLSATPAWFLHSRTAFETALAVSFFSGFLYFYLVYRMETALPALSNAVLLGALTFYTYPPLRLVLGVCALLLAVTDWRYHWRHRGDVLKALAFAGLLALPYLRFSLQHPGQTRAHLALLGSYWVNDELSLWQKMGSYFQEYLKGLDPRFWFLPLEQGVQIRHVLKDYGHLIRMALPFYALGLGVCLRNIHRAEARTVLIVTLAAPAGAAAVGMGVTRALVMVIPAALLAALGLDLAITWLGARLPVGPRKWLCPGVFLMLAAGNFVLLGDALLNGPTWFTDYGLSGMQYGARQLFGELRAWQKEATDTHLVVSPTWTNGADTVARFFFNDPFPLEMASVDSWLFERRELRENMLFVLTPEEYQRALDSNKFKQIHVETTLPYPNGLTGFYFTRMQYVDNIDEILAGELADRQKLVQDELKIGEQVVWVTHSSLDLGRIQDIFDGNSDTLARSAQANPLRIVLDFPQERQLNGLVLKVGSTETAIQIRVLDGLGRELEVVERQAAETVQPRNVLIEFDRPLQAARVEIQVKNVREGEPSHVHIWEVELQ